MVFHSSGFSKILCFKNETTKLLHLTKKDECDNDDLDNALKKVAHAIQTETNYYKQKRETYSIDIDRDIIRMPVSETLLDLLTKICPKFCGSLQALMIGNIIASELNCSPTDLQIALGIAMCRNKTLIQLLKKYGITCSYEEVLLFKYSAAVAALSALKGHAF